MGRSFSTIDLVQLPKLDASGAPSTLSDAPGNPGDPRSAPTRRSRMM